MPVRVPLDVGRSSELRSSGGTSLQSWVATPDGRGTSRCRERQPNPLQLPAVEFPTLGINRNFHSVYIREHKIDYDNDEEKKDSRSRRTRVRK